MSALCSRGNVFHYRKDDKLHFLSLVSFKREKMGCCVNKGFKAATGLVLNCFTFYIIKCHDECIKSICSFLLILSVLTKV